MSGSVPYSGAEPSLILNWNNILDFSRRHFMRVFSGAILTPIFMRQAMADDDGENSNSDDNDSDDEQDEASNHDDSSSRNEQKTIREAIKKNDAASYESLVNYLKKKYPGEVLNVALLKKSNRFFYLVKILTPKGKIIKLKLNAKTFDKI